MPAIGGRAALPRSGADSVRWLAPQSRFSAGLGEIGGGLRRSQAGRAAGRCGIARYSQDPGARTGTTTEVVVGCIQGLVENLAGTAFRCLDVAGPLAGT